MPRSPNDDHQMLQVIIGGRHFDKLQAFADEAMVLPDDLASQLLIRLIDDLKPGDMLHQRRM